MPDKPRPTQASRAEIAAAATNSGSPSARLFDITASALDFIEALRAGEISHADNIGSGKTAIALARSLNYTVECIRRLNSQDRLALIEAMRELRETWLWKMTILHGQDDAP